MRHKHDEDDSGLEPFGGEDACHFSLHSWALVAASFKACSDVSVEHFVLSRRMFDACRVCRLRRTAPPYI